MSKYKSFLPTLALATILGVGCTPPANPRVGGQAPSIELPAVEGDAFSLASLAGKVVVVDFWATWCGPCHIQADILERGVVPTWQPRGVEFVGINVGESADLVRGWLADHPSPYRTLLDENEEVFASLATGALPTLMVIDTQGRIAHLGAGVMAKDDLGEILARVATH